MAAKRAGEVGKRIVFDGETWQALHRLSLDSAKSIQELADEAFRDLLKKHQRDVAPECATASRERRTHGPANARAQEIGYRELLVAMNTGPAFWLILTVGGAVLIGVLLAYGLISRRRRR